MLKNLEKELSEYLQLHSRYPGGEIIPRTDEHWAIFFLLEKIAELQERVDALEDQ